MMLAMCLATVAGLMNSSLAMSLLLCPLATRAAISSSRADSRTAAGSAPFIEDAASASPAGGWTASSIAASAVSSRPRAQCRATASFPSWLAGARYRSTRDSGNGGRPLASRRALAAAYRRLTQKWPQVEAALSEQKETCGKVSPKSHFGVLKK